MIRKKFLPILICLFACTVFCPPCGTALAQDQNSTAETNFQAIRRAINTLGVIMLKYERGVSTNVGQLLKLLEPPANIQPDRRNTYILNAARRLYIVLQGVDYDPVDDIPQDITGDTATVHLGDSSGITVELQFIKKADGTWVISPETLESKRLRDVYEQLKQRYEKLTRADMEGETFRPDQMSPFRTMLTFTSGVRGIDGFTMKDALSTMDMSRINPVVQKLIGSTLAVYLSRALAFRCPLKLSELSADPLSDKIPILLVSPEFGVISMHVVENPETKAKAWKFTPKSLETAKNVYDKYMAEGMAKEIRDQKPEYMAADAPAHILIDDFFQKYAPSLETKYLDVNLWKWLLVALLILASPMLWIAIGPVMGGLEDFLLKHKQGEEGYKSILLPLRMAVIAYLWLQVLLIISVGRDVLLVAAYLLDFTIIVTSVWATMIVVNNLTDLLTGKTKNKVRGTIIQVCGKLLNLFLLVAGAVGVATLLGQDSTRILTALGIGGIALALAGKDTVENFLGTAMIVSTQPFAIGDWIIIKNIEGTVESVGVRSTSIRTFYNSLVSVPNATFVSSAVDNMGKRHYRRYKTIIGVEYGTPPSLIEAYVEGLKEIVRRHPRTRKDYFHVQPNEFGSSSIDILVYIFFVTDDWGIELQERGKFILDALRLAEKLGVNVAFPTHTLHMLQGEKPGYEDPGDKLTAEAMGRGAVLDLLGSPKSGKDDK